MEVCIRRRLQWSKIITESVKFSGSEMFALQEKLRGDEGTWGIDQSIV